MIPATPVRFPTDPAARERLADLIRWHFTQVPVLDTATIARYVSEAEAVS